MDDSNSEIDGFDHHGQDQQDKQTEPVFAARENKAVNALRLLTGAVLAVAAVTVCCSVFFLSRDSETGRFETGFFHLADKVVDGVQANAKLRFDALELLSAQITSYAMASNSTFPRVTLPDFEQRAQYTRQISQMIAIYTFMVVSDEERPAWEQYAGEEALNWLSNSLYYQARGDPKKVAIVDEQIANGTVALFPGISVVGRGGVSPAEAPGPYSPYWQLAPAWPAPLVNFDAFSSGSRGTPINETIKEKTKFLAEAVDFRNATDISVVRRRNGLQVLLGRDPTIKYADGPLSDVYFPIFETFQPDAPVKGVLSATLWWQGWFTSLLPPGANGVVAVLYSNCGDIFSFLIDGEDAVYVGPGDLHDRRYTDLKMTSPILSPDQDLSNSPFHCSYSVAVYPSEALERVYRTNLPVLSAIGLLGVFIFTSFVFLLYDIFVQRRHTVVNDTAVQSSAVVSNLFPDKVRDRMTTLYSDPEKARPSQAETGFRGGKTPVPVEEKDSVPIADLYENCSVLFSDMAGFTRWAANGRTPTDVFFLLETLYGELDTLAKKHNVFKVETIGDCYLAVTGLPCPQEQHAVILCRFAQACNMCWAQLLPTFVAKFGEDTAELGLRTGIHSGPVTAGVLRGDKARYQIFGDTVNTASRMESTGRKGFVHVSQETTDLLVASGKQSWVTKREDLVEAKGKGNLQTYWVRSTRVGTATTVASSHGDIENLPAI